MPARRPSIIAHHLIWTLYGHWLPNDLRGSGSSEIRRRKLSSLGSIHEGRKPAKLQPTRGELRTFQGKASPKLEFPTFWIDDAKRQAIRDAFAGVVAERGYTVWACAIMSNHVHAVIRVHRDDALKIWDSIAEASRTTLRSSARFTPDHSIWSSRPYKVFLRTPEEVRGRVEYVIRNPEKEGLAAQEFEFVRPYDNWPFHKLRRTRPR